MKKKFYAGAARSDVLIPEGYFPDENGFSGMHDPIYVRAVYLESNEKILLLSLDLTSVMGRNVGMLRDLAADAAGLKPCNVWLMVTHTFSVPHITNAEGDAKNDILRNAFSDAIKDASYRAVSEKKQARIGIGVGRCGINVNRDIQTEKGWWTGRSEEGPSDKGLNVIRLDDKDGTPISILFHYAVQSSACQGAKLDDGSLLVSGDIAGCACRYVEEEYGVPSLFLLGAAGDQVPVLSACCNEVDRRGVLREYELGERGYFLMEQLGRRLGCEVVHAAAGISSHELSGGIRLISEKVVCAGQKMDIKLSDLRPTQSYKYILNGDREATVDMIKLGNIVIVGTQAELSTVTAMTIARRSPYPYTLVCTMVNGGAKYMARRESYQMMTYEAMNSPFACGSAEKWEARVLEMLGDLWDAGSEAGECNEYTKC